MRARPATRRCEFACGREHLSPAGTRIRRVFGGVACPVKGRPGPYAIAPRPCRAFPIASVAVKRTPKRVMK